MTKFHPLIAAALRKIDFVRRYEALSAQFNAGCTPSAERLVYLDGEEVLDMIAALGYVPLFDKREKFFKIREEQVGALTFGVHIILRGGAVEVVWVVRRQEELLLGAPWGVYAKRLIAPDRRIPLPCFGTYEDLERILQTVFTMYEDFKQALLEEGEDYDPTIANG